MFKPANRRRNMAMARPHVPRREKRVDVTRAATIRLDDGQIVPCTMRDMHSRGARLSIADSSILPETFALRCGAFDIETMARVAWRKPHEIGVSFFRG